MCWNHVPLVLIVAAFCTVHGHAAPDWREEVNVSRRIYNAPLTVVEQQSTTLRRLASKQPLLVAFVFTRCSGVCSPFLLRLKESLELISTNVPYKVLVVSFDPRDTPVDMHSLRSALSAEGDSQWMFATTTAIDSLTASAGFQATWDSIRQQFDHDALLVGVNTQGFITKKLFGIRSTSDLASLVRSVNNEYMPTYRLPTSTDLFTCFTYDPATDTHSFGPGMLFIALPALVTLALIIGIRLAVR